MSKLGGYKNSLFKKFMLSFTLPVAIVSLIFSIVLYFTSMYIINNYVISEFEGELKLVSAEIDKDIDHQLVIDAQQGDTAKQQELLSSLNTMKKNYDVENVFILARKNNKETLVALSDDKEFNTDYTFDEAINKAIDKKNPTISEVYTDDYGTHKGMYTPFEDSEILLGVDMDASFIKTIQTVVIWMSIAIFIVAISFALTAASFISRGLITPINQTLAFVNTAASGDLTIQPFQLKSEDEIGKLALGVFKMVEDLRILINKVSSNSEHVASTSNELSANVQQSSATIEEITASVQHVAQNAESQSQNINGISTTLSTLSKDLDDIAVLTKTVAQRAGTTTDAAQKGNQTVQEAVTQLDITNSTIDQTAASIHRLNDYSVEIAEIVNLISDITDQTNLLALNASIEAARAGEHGKGFAVVAEEVRKLADQSQVAASDIQERINVIRNESMQAVTAMSSSTENLSASSQMFAAAGHSFKHIYEDVSQLSTKITETYSSIEQVTTALNTISTTLQNVNSSINMSSENTQNVAAASEEQSASIEEITHSAANLSEMAEELQASLVKFRV